MEIIEMMTRLDHDQIFLNQVTRSQALGYRDIVKNPICLKDMMHKTKRNEYKNRDMFLADIDLMKENSSLFNGENHPIT